MGDEGAKSSSPFSFTDRLKGDWLNNALDAGISELDFWEMTIAEINRAIASKTRVKHEEAKERAQFEYVLGDLIGRSIARLYGSANKYPAITDVFPSLFIEERKALEEHRNNISILRFKQFAQLHNKRMKEEANKIE